MATSVLVTDSDIERCQQLYDNNGVYGIWATLKGVSDTTSFKEEFFVKKNHFKRAIDRLASVFNFDFQAILQADGKALPKTAKARLDFEKFVNDFFSRPWEGELNFWQAAPFLAVRSFVDGAVYHKLIKKKDGKVYAVRMPARNVSIAGADEADMKSIGAYKFQYEVLAPNEFSTDGGATATITEEFRPGKITRSDGKSWDVPGNVLPVVMLLGEIQDASPKGKPLAMELIGPFMEYLRCLVDISSANVMTGNQVLVTIDAKTDGGSVGPGKRLDLHTDVLTSKPDAKYIGGNLNLQSLENEKNDHRNDIYLFAHVPPEVSDDIKDAPSGSGKARIVLSADQATYANQRRTFMAGWISEFVRKAYFMETGVVVEKGDVTVTLPPIDGPDPVAQERRAQMYVDMGAVRKGLKELGNDPEEVDEIEAEIQDGDIAGNGEPQLDENGDPINLDEQGNPIPPAAAK